jgi:hypothetical protein
MRVISKSLHNGTQACAQARITPLLGALGGCRDVRFGGERAPEDLLPEPWGVEEHGAPETKLAAMASESETRTYERIAAEVIRPTIRIGFRACAALGSGRT